MDQFEPGSTASAAILSNFRSTLREHPESRISVYIESLDLGRFRGARYRDTVHAYFREKYGDKQVGIIVAVGSAALELVLYLRAQLWADVPVIFAAVDEVILDELSLPPNVTGMTVAAPLSGAVSVARMIVPGLKRIAIVGDPPERQFIRRQMPTQLELLAAEFELIDLTRLTMTELKQRVSALPSDSAIIYLGLTLDAANVAYTSYEALAMLAPAANRPTIIQAETHLGTGAVGGIVSRFGLIGSNAAGLVLRVLAGENPTNIPISSGHSMKPIFDWRQLQRWNVPDERMPPGSEVRFRPPTLWDQYKWFVVAAFAVSAVQAIFIVGLLLSQQRLRRANTQRRRAEAAANEVSARFIHAQEEDRSRLARELHDDVTQRLASLAIDAGREERKSLNSLAGSAMRTMREHLVRLSEDVHALSYRLHPSIVEDLGLLEALKAECERHSTTCLIRLDGNPEAIPENLPRDVALCLFRIVQEGLRNIARHAGASQAEVQLRSLDGGLQLSVRDNGDGFDPAQNRSRMSLGHASMRQRVSLLGGKVDIVGIPGQGTTISAWVPLQGRAS